MNSIQFDIRHPDGRADQIRLEAERALIGSGAHCEIRLPVDQAAIEHVLIQVTPGGVMAEARSFEPPPTVNGTPLTRAVLTPGSYLGVGNVQIYVTVFSMQGGGPETAQQKEKSISPMTLVLSVLIIPFGIYVIFFSDPPEEEGAQPQEIPELWAEPVTKCPQSGTAAVAFAEGKWSVAVSKRERRPFHVQEGVAAVPLFEQAAACFKAGGETRAARVSNDYAETLRDELANDFRTHRVRLEYALSRKNWEVAQKEVRVLLNFLEGQQHEYVNWLSNLDRRLRIKYGDQSKGKKKK